MPHLAARTQGSPPLARGTVSAEGKIQRRAGITPACAGNRGAQGRRFSAAGDHPRLRGEQSPGGYITYPGEGSPPLARGTVLCAASCRPHAGITPACAGNSLMPKAKNCKSKDHPRLRGEQCSVSAVIHSFWGSPPLARGTAGHAAAIQRLVGITPACAGNRCVG